MSSIFSAANTAASRTSQGFRRAVAAYRRAVELDPGYAAAYAGLAIAECQVADWSNDAPGYVRAQEAADRAVALEPQQAAGYYARGYIRYRRAWFWAGAQADFEKALSIDPGSGDARREYGLLLFTIGRIPEAISETRRAADLDPLSGDAWAYLQRMYFAAGDQKSARQAARRAMELQPQSFRALVAYGTSQLLDGRALEARSAFEKIDDPGLRLTGEAMAEHALGHAAVSAERLRDAIAKNAEDSAYQIAQTHAWRGEKDEAFKWLDRAFRQRDGGLVLLKNDALLVSLRGDPRFQALLLKLNMP